MKYRKTALVEAEQFLPAEGKIPAGVIADGLSDPRKSPSQWVLDTLEGRHSLRPGDYICTGPAGERWNVERSIFEATYEPVTTPARAEAQDEDTPCTDCGDTGVTHQTERRCSCQEAEAQDEGAAGEREALARIIDTLAFDADGDEKSKPSNVRRRALARSKASAILAHWANADPVAYAIFWRHGVTTHPTREAALDAPGRTVQEPVALYAHPSPTPAADADRVRIAVEALEKISNRRSIVFGRGEMSGQEAFGIAKEALAALKSTAAKEGGK